MNEKEDYIDDISLIQKEVKYEIKNMVFASNVFSNNFMFDLDIRSSGIKFNKKSFLSFEIHLLHNEDFHKLSEVSDDINEIISKFTTKLKNILTKYDFQSYIKK